MIIQYEKARYCISDSTFSPDETIAELGFSVAVTDELEKLVHRVADLADIDLTGRLTAYARLQFYRFVIESGYAARCRIPLMDL